MARPSRRALATSPIANGTARSAAAVTTAARAQPAPIPAAPESQREAGSRASEAPMASPHTAAASTTSARTMRRIRAPRVRGTGVARSWSTQEP